MRRNFISLLLSTPVNEPDTDRLFIVFFPHINDNAQFIYLISDKLCCSTPFSLLFILPIEMMIWTESVAIFLYTFVLCLCLSPMNTLLFFSLFSDEVLSLLELWTVWSVRWNTNIHLWISAQLNFQYIPIFLLSPQAQAQSIVIFHVQFIYMNIIISSGCLLVLVVFAMLPIVA